MRTVIFSHLRIVSFSRRMGQYNTHMRIFISLGGVRRETILFQTQALLAHPGNNRGNCRLPGIPCRANQNDGRGGR